MIHEDYSTLSLMNNYMSSLDQEVSHKYNSNHKSLHQYK